VGRSPIRLKLACFGMFRRHLPLNTTCRVVPVVAV